MSIRNFIGASSAILLAWLGATYFHKVPAERYPKHGKPVSALSLKTDPASHKTVARTIAPETENR